MNWAEFCVTLITQTDPTCQHYQVLLQSSLKSENYRDSKRRGKHFGFLAKCKWNKKKVTNLAGKHRVLRNLPCSDTKRIYTVCHFKLKNKALALFPPLDNWHSSTENMHLPWAALDSRTCTGTLISYLYLQAIIRISLFIVLMSYKQILRFL